MKSSVCFLVVFLLSLAVGSCKQGTQTLSDVRSDQVVSPAVTNSADASCNIDPAAVYADLMKPSGRFNGPARRFQEISTGDVQGTCQGTDRPGANDPTCKAYCDTCTSSLPATANTVFFNAISVVQRSSVLFEIMGKSAALEVLAGRLALLFDFMNSKYNLDPKLQTGICGSTIFEMARVLVSFNETGLGHSKADKVARLICGVNLAVNSCDAVPALAVLVTPVKTALMSNPFIKGGSVAMTLTCTAGQFLADKVIKCPAFKRACTAALENAQPVDNRACCVCGTRNPEGRMIMPWGSMVYAGSRYCEDLDSATIHRKLQGVPDGENLKCERTEVDTARTGSCAFEQVVYGHTFSCGRDNGIYCVKNSIFTADGRELRSPGKALNSNCTTFVTPQQLLERIQGYAPVAALQTEIDISADVRSAAPE